MIKKAGIALLSIVLVFAFSACSDTTPEPAEKEIISSQINSEENTIENESEENTEMNSNILVVYFSCP
ncbi:MAG: flavodoxin, partial [Eubacterium sp.]|nr:flavodoxin [Eubacterium sp.]